MSVINQKEYLKKYLSLGDEKEQKKRKKKSRGIKDRVKIIDDDIDVPHNINEDEMKEFLTAEDAPQVVGIVDERPLSMRIDDYRKSDKWKLVGSDDELKEKENEVKTKSKKSNNSDSDVSPPRRSSKNKDASPRRSRKMSEDSSPQRRFKNNYDSDVSSAQITKNIDSDASPPRKSKRSSENSRGKTRKVLHTNSRMDIEQSNFGARNKRTSDSDASPPRNKRKSNDRASLSQINKRLSDSDTSPPRRNKKLSDSDTSPHRRNKRLSDSDTSPPRRNKRLSDPGTSPPRRNKRLLDSDTNPPRKSKNQSDSDASPPRRNKKRSSPPKSSKMRSPEISPKRMKINSHSEQKTRKSRWDAEPTEKCHSENKSSVRNDSVSSPPRRNILSKEKNKRSQSPGNSKKLTKTLDGKTAGIQNAKDLKTETALFKKREDDMFKNMTSEMSGKDAGPILRDRKTGKRRDLEKEAMEEMEKQQVEKEKKVKYDKWGKGLKQVEDHKQKLEEEIHEMSKPLARYAGDEDLERYLKEQEREGDPMLAYIRKKKRKDAEASGKPIDLKPQYEGEFMPNRYGIPPGHRWDGVDRSNGYEKEWFKVQNSKKAVEEDIYKWSTEDM